MLPRRADGSRLRRRRAGAGDYMRLKPDPVFQTYPWLGCSAPVLPSPSRAPDEGGRGGTLPPCLYTAPGLDPDGA